MTNKEAKEIALSLAVVLDSIFSEDCNPEEVANNAIDAARDIIKNNPKVEEWVACFFECDTESPDFSKQWDRHIALLGFLKD